MSLSDRLPKFRSPPVDEVSVGCQFQTSSPFLPTHYGAFYNHVKSAFPNVQVLPPIPPSFGPFSPPAAGNNQGPRQSLLGMVPFPRTLFVAEDDCSLIQLQGDRLYFNWRKRPDHKYEHFPFIRAGFALAYKACETLAAEEGFGPIVPFHCEVLYVNPLGPAVTGVTPSAPEEVFRVWNANTGDEWNTQIKDLSFNARYEIRDDSEAECGGLVATMSTGVYGENVAQMRLELIASGPPRGDSLDGVRAFHEIAHDAIVRCFAGLTTPAMHARWGRIYE